MIIVKPLTLSTINAVLEFIQRLISCLGLILGGGWAYFKYINGRVFKRRIDLSISGEHISVSPNAIRAKIEVKNVGMSAVRFSKKGTGVIVDVLDVASPDGVTTELEQEDFDCVNILEQHDWIEPGETIREEVIAYFSPPDLGAFRLTLRVVSSGSDAKQRSAWLTTCIVISSNSPEAHEGV